MKYEKKWAYLSTGGPKISFLGSNFVPFVFYNFDKWVKSAKIFHFLAQTNLPSHQYQYWLVYRDP